MALQWFRRALPDRKADGSEVTDADHAAEEVLVEGLIRLFPGDTILSEEGTRHQGGPAVWYVDPIDGTSAFLDQLAHWGPTLCRVVDGRLEVGALWIPRLGELWFAERDRGAWRNGERLRSPDPGRIGRHDAMYLPSRFHRRQPLAWPGKVRALGSSAVHLAQVAAGGGVATLIPRWEVWDVGCGILLVEEAGRQVTALDGTALDPLARPGRPFLAGTPSAIRYLSDHGIPRPSRA